METIEIQHEEIQITAANSDKSLSLSNITSDAEKLDELMNVLFSEENEDSISISIVKCDQLSRQSTIRKSDTESSSNEPETQDNYNQETFAQYTNTRNFNNHPLPDHQRKRAIDEIHLKYMYFQEIQEMEEEYNSIEKTSKQFEQKKEIIRNKLRMERAQNNLINQASSERSEETQQEASLSQIGSNNEFIHKNSNQSTLTLNSIGSDNLLVSPKNMQQKQKFLQSQFGDLQSQQEYFCGCITKNQLDNDEEVDFCNVF